MTFFSTNHSEASTGDFQPVDEGTYEVFISSVEKTTFSTGAEGLNLQFTIRGDLEQDFANRKLFDRLVCSEKAMFRWNNISKATNMPDGQTFNSAQEVIQAFGEHLNGKPLRVTIKHREWEGKIREEVKAYSESDYEGGQASNAFDASQYASQDPFAEDGKPIDISDDDLPF